MLPVLEIPHDYVGGVLMLRNAEEAGGRDTIVLLHKRRPTLWFDEVRQQWRELVGHISEIRHGA